MDTPSVEDFRETWERIYGCWEPRGFVWRLTFCTVARESA